MRAVVMAGGEGSRLRPLTVRRPKPLVPVANVPIVGHGLNLLRRHGITEAAVTLHYLATEIERVLGDGSDYGVSLTYSTEPIPLGTAGSVKLLHRWLSGGTFVIISGDALTDVDLTAALAFHREKGSVATLVLKSVPDPLEFGVVATDEEGRILRFFEKPGWSELFSDTVNTGLYILEPEVLDLLDEGKPGDWSTDVFARLMEAGAPIYGYVTDRAWTDIGTMGQYVQSNWAALDGDVDLGLGSGQLGSDIWVGEGTVVDPGAHLFGPVMIGRNCRIKKGASIGPYVVMGDNTLVEEGAQVERSVVWEGCYLGVDTQTRGATLADRVTLKRDAVIEEDAVLGTRCLVDVGGQVRPRVKLWPDKRVERGSTVTMSLVEGTQWRGTLFRELGVAGLSNVEATPEFATRLGLAFGSLWPEGSRVVLSRDSARSSRMLKRAVAGALLSCGCRVVDLHGAPVPVVRHHIRVSGARAGVNIRKTPSNARMNLFEFLDRTGGYVPRALERKIEAAFYREEFRRIDHDELGLIEEGEAPLERYRSDFQRAMRTQTLGRRLRIAVDFGFSSVSAFFPALLQETGVEVISLDTANDARRSPRTEGERAEHLERLGQIVGSLDYDAGFLLTDDGERLHVVDNLGRPLEGYQMLAVLAGLVARQTPGARIGLSVAAPDRLAAQLEHLGAKVVRTGSASRDLIDLADREELLFAGDAAGGFVFPEFHAGFDALFGSVRLLELLAAEDRRLSELVAELPEFPIGYRLLGCPWHVKGAVMRTVSEMGTTGATRLETTDGVKLYFGEDWVLVRPDEFESAVHLYAEGATTVRAQELLDRVSAVVVDVNPANAV